MIDKAQILVVEDDLLVSEVIAAALDDTYTVVIVETAAEALALLKQGGVRLVLLDCTLPGGLDAGLLPEADARGAPVVLMSGDPGRMATLATRGRPFIVKPFTLTGLIDTVEKVLSDAVHEASEKT